MKKRNPESVKAWNSSEKGKASMARYAENNKEVIMARRLEARRKTECLTKNRIIEAVSNRVVYDRATGVFTHARLGECFFKTISACKRHNSLLAGNIAGSPIKNGAGSYWQIQYDGKHVPGHQLAWFMATGEHIPDGASIDHVNGNGLDNRIENLRVVFHAENMRNKRIYKNSKTGIFGVSVDRHDSERFSVRISKQKKRISLGVFDDFFEACCVRKSAEIRFGYHKNHGRLMDDEEDALAVARSIWPNAEVA